MKFEVLAEHLITGLDIQVKLQNFKCKWQQYKQDHFHSEQQDLFSSSKLHCYSAWEYCWPPLI